MKEGSAEGAEKFAKLIMEKISRVRWRLAMKEGSAEVAEKFVNSVIEKVNRVHAKHKNIKIKKPKKSGAIEKTTEKMLRALQMMDAAAGIDDPTGACCVDGGCRETSESNCLGTFSAGSSCPDGCPIDVGGT